MKKNIATNLLLLTIVVVIIISLIPYAFDDAYIHFRISENFAHYFSPYFNISERVMSTSSFVWTCVLALISKFPASLPIKVSILNSILIIIGSVIWSHLLSIVSEQEVSGALKFIFQIIYIGALLSSAAGLMETPLALAILGLSIYLLATNRSSGWIFLVFAIFTRYEVFIYAGLFFLIWIFKKGDKNKLTGLGLFLIPTMLLFLVIYYFYSTIIPNTVIAKQLVYQIPIFKVFGKVFYSLIPNLASIYNVIAILFRMTIRSQIIKLLSSNWMPSLFIGSTFVSIVIVAWKTKILNSQAKWSFGILVGGFIVAIVYIIKHVFLFEWYIPLFSIPIIFGIYQLALPRRIFMRVVAVIVSLIPISNLIIYTYSALVFPSNLPTVCEGARVQRYIQVGEYLNNLYPNVKLLSTEIGGLGYSFSGDIIDADGLISPFALKYHPMKIPEERANGEIGAIPPKLVADISPELIVSYPIFVQEFDTSKYVNAYRKISIPAFSKVYREKTNCTSIWRCDELYIFIRNDIANDQIVSFLKEKFNN